MEEKKIYFTGEAIVNGKSVQTGRIEKVVDAETEEPIYEDAFGITEHKDIEKYENKDDFIMRLLSEVYFALKMEGEIEGAVILNAIEEGTDICKWGIKMEILNDEEFQYETFGCMA